MTTEEEKTSNANGGGSMSSREARRTPAPAAAAGEISILAPAAAAEKIDGDTTDSGDEEDGRVDPSATSATEARLCDGCGLPPRVIMGGDGQRRRFGRMLVCSRCRAARYHDVECQRRHFPQHRASCRQAALALAAAVKTRAATEGDGAEAGCTEETTRAQSVACEVRRGRGRCMVARLDLPAGSRPIEWDGALVPPVLNVANRNERCSFCFCALGDQCISRPSSSGGALLHRHCSTPCRDRDGCWEEEEGSLLRASQKRRGGGGDVTVPTPTVLLVTRILRRLLRDHDPALPLGAQQGAAFRLVAELQSNLDKFGEEEVRTFDALARLSLLTLSRLKSRNGGANSGGGAFDARYVTELVARVVTNGFSVSDGEQVAVGVGVYPSGATANHSCRPNAIQTFHFSRGETPTLSLTACGPIKAREEVTISYIDSSAPTERRRKQLSREYKFNCTCDKCRDTATDDFLVGIRCPRARCGGIGRRGRLSPGGASDGDGTALSSGPWVCGDCDHDGFAAAIERRDRAVATAEMLPKGGCVPNIAILEEAFETLGQCCSDTSWYRLWCGELLVQSLLDCMGSEEGSVREACTRALAVFGRIQPSVDACFSSSNSGNELRRSIVLYKAAKLRLFLDPDPRPALAILRDVQETLRVYYRRDHEVVTALEQCIAGTS